MIVRRNGYGRFSAGIVMPKGGTVVQGAGDNIGGATTVTDAETGETTTVYERRPPTTKTPTTDRRVPQAVAGEDQIYECADGEVFDRTLTDEVDGYGRRIPVGCVPSKKTAGEDEPQAPAKSTATLPLLGGAAALLFLLR